jgi:hypothetical protein
MVAAGLYPREMDYRRAYTLTFIGKGVAKP